MEVGIYYRTIENSMRAIELFPKVTAFFEFMNYAPETRFLKETGFLYTSLT
ncbi:MAG: hypothetical protein MUE44_02915 [Oscillatoriaceae cyanobacterium Prado104]|nr:hypothetical protein [Oscillatoriaceae cyanobacterium Prado104]